MATKSLLIFADLIGSTDVAAEATFDEFSNGYLASFYWAADRAFKSIKKEGMFENMDFQYHIEKPSLSGDEAYSMTFFKEESTRIQVDAHEEEIVIASAIAFSNNLKIFWLASPYNLNRLLSGQFPREIAIGIHIGPVGIIPKQFKGSSVAGIHVNLAKRIETYARAGQQSKIFASYDVVQTFKRWKNKHIGDKNRAPNEQAPIVHMHFQKLKESFKTKSIPNSLSLHELCVDKKSTYLSIIEYLYETPETPDAEVEKFAKSMGELFFDDDDKQIFVLDLLEYSKLNDIGSASEYIKKWFEAMNSRVHMFMGVEWLLMTCYFVSSCFLRHNSIQNLDSNTKDNYQRISETLYKDYKEITEAN